MEMLLTEIWSHVAGYLSLQDAARLTGEASARGSIKQTIVYHLPIKVTCPLSSQNSVCAGVCRNTARLQIKRMYLEQIEKILPHYAHPYDEEALKSPEGASNFPAVLISRKEALLMITMATGLLLHIHWLHVHFGCEMYLDHNIRTNVLRTWWSCSCGRSGASDPRCSIRF